MNKTKINQRDLLQLAKQIKIELTPEDIADILPQVNNVLASVPEINKIDTTNYEPVHVPITTYNPRVIRDDKPKNFTNFAKNIQKNNLKNNYFVIKK